MKTRGTGVVGYNVQVAVDAKHHLIVARKVTNNGIDRDELTSMAKLARTEIGVDKLTAAICYRDTVPSNSHRRRVLTRSGPTSA
jgi:hypothetical protein